jgi:hypothetical protein
MLRVFAVSLTLVVFGGAIRGVWAASSETRVSLRVHAARRWGGWISGSQAAERFDLHVAGRVERIYF